MVLIGMWTLYHADPTSGCVLYIACRHTSSQLRCEKDVIPPDDEIHLVLKPLLLPLPLPLPRDARGGGLHQNLNVHHNKAAGGEVQTPLDVA